MTHLPVCCPHGTHPFDAMFHSPKTAPTWVEFVGRFADDEPALAAMEEGRTDPRKFDWPWMAVHDSEDEAKELRLSWLDLYVFWCLRRGVVLSEAVKGPEGGMSLGREFNKRRKVFRL
jgi:hypothetical protein